MRLVLVLALLVASSFAYATNDRDVKSKLSSFDQTVHDYNAAVSSAFSEVQKEQRIIDRFRQIPDMTLNGGAQMADGAVMYGCMD